MVYVRPFLWLLGIVAGVLAGTATANVPFGINDGPDGIDPTGGIRRRSR